MNLFRNLLSFIIIISYISVNAQKIEIGILSGKKPKKLFVESLAGKYKVKSGKKTICKLKNGRSVIIDFSNSKFSLSNAKRDFGLYKEINIENKKYNFEKIHDRLNSKKKGELNIKLIEPKHDVKIYQGNMKLTVSTNTINIINQVGLADYIAGVVEAESGSKAEEEYYKNQAVICHTYALKNHEKHKSEGYNLCDGVHCQAYKGKSTSNPIIQKAVKKTKNLVIIDKDGELISSVFSANCGGETNNSEDVWTSKVSYLRSIQDEFCMDQRQAQWKKTIEKDDFIKFLKEKNINISDTIASDSLSFEQETRKINYSVNNQEIKLTTIRNVFNLRSTFFSITTNGKQLNLSGRGYGHGVGMCQEGAMNMARKGYKFDEIIRYYYKDVDIIPVFKLKIKLPYYN